MSYNHVSRSQDPIPTRGDKGPSPPGTLLFLTLRLTDPVIQHSLLRPRSASSVLSPIRLFSLLGTTSVEPAPPPHTRTPLDLLNLSPDRLLLWLMAIGSTIKQCFWLLHTAEEKIPASTAIMVSSVNTISNSINNLLFICKATSPAITTGQIIEQRLPQNTMLVGVGLYVLGMGVEIISEIQRGRFKKDRRNKGRIYTGGLFSLVRHVNYTGYWLWRTGYALAAGGWMWGLVNAMFYLFNFTRSIPPLNHYCEEHYGHQWQNYKHLTPYRMIPYVY